VAIAPGSGFGQLWDTPEPQIIKWGVGWYASHHTQCKEVKTELLNLSLSTFCVSLKENIVPS